MTWVRGPRSTFGVPSFEKRDPPPYVVLLTPKFDRHVCSFVSFLNRLKQQKISALVTTYDACQLHALTNRETAQHE
jgi:hypothetical protein